MSVTARRAPVFESSDTHSHSFTPLVSAETILTGNSKPPQTSLADLNMVLLRNVDVAHRITMWLADACVNDSDGRKVVVLDDFLTQLADTLAWFLGWDSLSPRGLLWRGVRFVGEGGAA